MKILSLLRDQSVGVLALVVALSGTAYAAGLPRGSVGTSQLKGDAVIGNRVKNGSLTGSDIKDRSLSGKDVKDRSLTRADLGNRSVTAPALGAPLMATVRLTPGAPVTSQPSDGSVTAIPWDEEVVDTGDLWDPATPTRITIPRTGVWRFDAQVGFSGSAAGTRHVALFSPDGSFLGDDILGNVLLSPGTSSSTIPLSTVARLSAGDRVSLSVHQNSGTALTLDGVVTGTSMTVTYVGSAPS